ncbi:MAG TPA: J domain-containing protein [Polyangiaceae bacterium]|nr:J domain-containing protein [Polyangiaceae bacterium]
MARRRPHGSIAAAAPAPGLELHHAPARVQVLLRERARLVREAQKKKLQLEQLTVRISREGQELAANMAPLVERHRSLVAGLAALFVELLASSRLSKRARTQVTQIRRSLEVRGLLSPIDDWAAEHPADGEIDDPWIDDPWDPRSGASDPSRFGGRPDREQRRHQQPPERGSGPDTHIHDASAAEVAGARQVGQEKRSLRDIFRNLARAIHPDKARHEAERAQRTEVMKQVTQAYEDGDLARLIELESAWQGEVVDTGSGDLEARCRELGRINRELLSQVRQLTREIRDIKREAQEIFQGASASEVVAGATQELDEVQSIYESLRQFRDCQITLAELRRRTSPASPSREELELLEALMLEEMGLWPAPARRSPRQRT